MDEIKYSLIFEITRDKKNKKTLFISLDEVSRDEAEKIEKKMGFKQYDTKKEGLKTIVNLLERRDYDVLVINGFKEKELEEIKKEYKKYYYSKTINLRKETGSTFKRYMSCNDLEAGIWDNGDKININNGPYSEAEIEIILKNKEMLNGFKDVYIIKGIQNKEEKIFILRNDTKEILIKNKNFKTIKNDLNKEKLSLLDWMNKYDCKKKLNMEKLIVTNEEKELNNSIVVDVLYYEMNNKKYMIEKRRNKNIFLLVFKEIRENKDNKINISRVSREFSMDEAKDYVREYYFNRSAAEKRKVKKDYYRINNDINIKRIKNIKS